MILEKRMGFNIHRFDGLPGVGERAVQLVQSYLRIVPVYRGAMKEVCTKLEVLDEEFQILHDHNPIHHIECRLKSPESIVEKMTRKDIPFTVEALRENIQDIAGLRVVCNYTSDIYRLSEVLISQGDITLIRKSDYIASPKPSGYRSLHLVVMTPVSMVEGTQMVPVEIQLRTIAMDMWASLEHELRYKTGDGKEQDAEELRNCADDLHDVDLRMRKIFARIKAQKG